MSRPEPILILVSGEARVNWHINQPWSVKDPKPAFVADRLATKAYFAAFGSENVHALYRDWRGIIMAIGKLFHHYPYDEKMVGDLQVLQSQESAVRQALAGAIGRAPGSS
jgi:hypothetical protein